MRQRLHIARILEEGEVALACPVDRGKACDPLVRMRALGRWRADEGSHLREGQAESGFVKDRIGHDVLSMGRGVECPGHCRGCAQNEPPPEKRKTCKRSYLSFDVA